MRKWRRRRDEEVKKMRRWRRRGGIREGEEVGGREMRRWRKRRQVRKGDQMVGKKMRRWGISRRRKEWEQIRFPLYRKKNFILDSEETFFRHFPPRNRRSSSQLTLHRFANQATEQS